MPTDTQKMAELMSEVKTLKQELAALGGTLETLRNANQQLQKRLESEIGTADKIIAALAMTYGEDNGGGYWTLKVPDVAIQVAPLAMFERTRNEAERSTHIMIRIKGQ